MFEPESLENESMEKCIYPISPSSIQEWSLQNDGTQGRFLGKTLAGTEWWFMPISSSPILRQKFQRGCQNCWFLGNVQSKVKNENLKDFPNLLLTWKLSRLPRHHPCTVKRGSRFLWRVNWEGSIWQFMAAPFLRWQLPDSQIRLRFCTSMSTNSICSSEKTCISSAFLGWKFTPLGLSPLGLFPSEAISFFVTLLIKSGNPRPSAANGLRKPF